MNHGGSWNFDFGKVKYVNAIHSSSFPDGTNGKSRRFCYRGRTQNIYIAGDTTTMDMKLIPMRTKLDLAILPIGDNFTMDIEDAIVASDFIECDKVLGITMILLVILKLIIKQPFKSFPIKEKI
jgi:L-ascorbate metabolism protein UlaG (beta-lactamase superfamily)